MWWQPFLCYCEFKECLEPATFSFSKKDALDWFYLHQSRKFSRERSTSFINENDLQKSKESVISLGENDSDTEINLRTINEIVQKSHSLSASDVDRPGELSSAKFFEALVKGVRLKYSPRHEACRAPIKPNRIEFTNSLIWFNLIINIKVNLI
jgi:hypothetical protein